VVIVGSMWATPAGVNLAFWNVLQALWEWADGDAGRPVSDERYRRGIPLDVVPPAMVVVDGVLVPHTLL